MSTKSGSGGLGTGLLFVSTVILVLASFAWAQSPYKTLYRFKGGKDGSGPQAGLIFDTTGSLYGTTTLGGAPSGGTVFKLTPNSNGGWKETVLYAFCSLANCVDGSLPRAGLISDSDANLYGTTSFGGANYANYYAGTVFKLTPGSDGRWTESVIYNFCSLTHCTDGALPFAGLISDGAGNLYGTTQSGGANNRGAVFKLTPNSNGAWTESVIYSFCSLAQCDDGSSPTAGLIFDAAGNLYGTTYYPDGKGFGTVFRLKPNSEGSWTESVLYGFANALIGGEPYAGVVFDQTGNLYGTDWGAGKSGCNSYGCGAVFRLTPNAHASWKEKTLHLFTSGRDGGTPYAGLIFDTTGNLYGTASVGGAKGYGVVFKLAPATGGWSYRVLHSFYDHPGANPYSSLVIGASGNLYGTTMGDSIKTFGSVFEIVP